jgi:hypothetical protein
MIGYNSDTCEHVVTIVNSNIRRNHGAASTPPRLPIEAVFWRHTHKHVNKASATHIHQIGPVGPIWPQSISNSLKVAASNYIAIEPN